MPVLLLQAKVPVKSFLSYEPCLGPNFCLTYGRKFEIRVVLRDAAASWRAWPASVPHVFVVKRVVSRTVSCALLLFSLFSLYLINFCVPSWGRRK